MAHLIPLKLVGQVLAPNPLLSLKSLHLNLAVLLLLLTIAEAQARFGLHLARFYAPPERCSGDEYPDRNWRRQGAKYHALKSVTTVSSDIERVEMLLFQFAADDRLRARAASRKYTVPPGQHSICWPLQSFSASRAPRTVSSPASLTCL